MIVCYRYQSFFWDWWFTSVVIKHSSQRLICWQQLRTNTLTFRKGIYYLIRVDYVNSLQISILAHTHTHTEIPKILKSCNELFLHGCVLTKTLSWFSNSAQLTWLKLSDLCILLLKANRNDKRWSYSSSENSFHRDIQCKYIHYVCMLAST